MSRAVKSPRVAAVTLAVSLLLAACGSSSSSSSHSSRAASASATASVGVAPAQANVSVAISSYAFHPPSLTVAPGAKVKFTNHDQTAHTATGHSGAFDTGTLKPGQSATVTFKRSGTYSYYCQFHAFMTATIVVK